MFREFSFSGLDGENPYHHLREFEQMCSCYAFAGMTHDTLSWKLFPFSLVEEARQWYTKNVESVNGSWSKLRDKFCLRFFPESRIVALQKDILCFQQNEEETIGEAWARFSLLVKSGPVLSIPDHVLLQHIYSGLDKESANHLDASVGGFFFQKTLIEGMKILDHITENNSFVSKSRPSREEIHQAIRII